MIGLLAGGATISEACARAGLDRATLWRWQKENEAFAGRCLRARKLGASVLEDEISKICRDVQDPDGIHPDRARVAINGLTWLAKIRDPDTYADKQKLEHGGGVSVKVILEGGEE